MLPFLFLHMHLSNEDRAMIQYDNFLTGKLFFSCWFRVNEELFILEKALLYFILEEKRKSKNTQG